MDKASASRSEQVDSLFQRTLPVIHTALVSYYRLTEEEAREAEQDLYVWFHRLARRGGSGQTPVKGLRLSLLSAACQYGRSFQIWKLGGAPSGDERLNDLLAKEAMDVAQDLIRPLDEETW
jgi:hypothetical protein